MTYRKYWHTALLMTILISPPALRAADQAQINHSGQDNTGALSINQVAGNLNQQANIRAIANNPDGQAAVFLSAGLLNSNQTIPVKSASARIEGDSFSHNTGMIGVNQTAGSQNSSVNLVGIAYGAQGASVSAASEALLAGTHAASPQQTHATQASFQTSISDQAFQGSKGIVQVNQVAGAMNQAVNSLTVSFVRPEGN